MAGEERESFRISHKRQGNRLYESIDRLAYHLGNLMTAESKRDVNHESKALQGTLSHIFDEFNVQDETARTLVRQALSDSNMNSRVGLILEFHIGQTREGLELESTELVTGKVINLRDRNQKSSQAHVFSKDLRESIGTARRNSNSVRIHIQRKHHRLRIKWETFDRANGAVLTTEPSMLSRVRHVFG